MQRACSFLDGLFLNPVIRFSSYESALKANHRAGSASVADSAENWNAPPCHRNATARVCALHRKDNGFAQGKAFLFVGRILQLNPAWVYCLPICRIEKRNPAYNYNLDVGVRLRKACVGKCPGAVSFRPTNPFLLICS